MGEALLLFEEFRAPEKLPAYVDWGAYPMEADTEYRYCLWREWAEGKGTVVFVMLNPSKAHGKKDDHTIKKCVKYAKRWGFKRLVVVNLFAFRATDPTELRLKLRAKDFDGVGPLNEEHLQMALAKADKVVAAYGAHAFSAARAREVLAFIQVTHDVFALQVSKEGRPMHPARLADALEPVLFVPRHAER